MVESIQIKGARQHNLKNIDVEIPRGKLVVITGPSGSGKSSLAFHTLYAEGQRRYVESLSVYARQFLDQLEKPDVDSITGLSPAIAIEQRGGGVNPRSTIATATEIHDYLRILYATAGVPHDPKSGQRLEKATSAEVTNALMSQTEGSQLILLSPISLKNVKGDEQVESFIADLQRQGFVRLRIKGEMVELEEAQASWPKRLKECEVVIDRLVVKEKSRSRIADSVETALRVCDEEIRAIVRPDRDAEWENLSYVTSYRNVETGFIMPDLTPGLFSFNSHTGACPACHGLGTEMFCDKQLLVPDPLKTLNEDAVQGPWTKSSNAGKKGMAQRQLEAIAHYFNVDFDTPFSKLPQAYQDGLFSGTGDDKIEVEWEKDGTTIQWKKKFEGLCPQIERLNRETKSESVKRSTSNFMRSQRCRVCEGKRLKPEVLGVKIYSKKKACGGIGIQDFCHLSIREARQWLETLQLTEEVHQVCGSVQAEVLKRLSFLEDVGLHYLGLDRVSATLSGGESQRIRLATQLGAGLAGVLYVLDEPSIGLHSSDNDRLIGALTRLRDLGNTVVVVEHDEEMMHAADLIIDVGPKAGVDGGEIIAVATPKELVKIEHSPTGQWLSGKVVSQNEAVERRPKSAMTEWISLQGIRENNLQDLTVEIPLGTFTCITGPSGSGKSTLVNRILKPALRRQIHRMGDFPGDFDGLTGAEKVTRVVVVDQKPIGKSPRSNPATYSGAMDLLRDIYAQLPLAKERGYKAGRFSFNVKGGRCEKCQGGGLLRIDMHFLPDVFIKCDSCDGQRYNRETLEVTYRGYSIAQVLAMTSSEALALFEKVPKLAQILRALNDVGLGYVRLGQAANTLSGGEAQRVKLATELAKTSHGHVLYILDEPTTGLHFADVDLLMACLFRLREAGHSLVVIEHHLDVIGRADHVIDLGPGGGSEGGELVATGSPEEIQQVKRSLTGKWLKKNAR